MPHDDDESTCRARGSQASLIASASAHVHTTHGTRAPRACAVRVRRHACACTPQCGRSSGRCTHMCVHVPQHATLNCGAPRPLGEPAVQESAMHMSVSELCTACTCCAPASNYPGVRAGTAGVSCMDASCAGRLGPHFWEIFDIPGGRMQHAYSLPQTPTCRSPRTRRRHGTCNSSPRTH
jgi:hypothetical protein